MNQRYRFPSRESDAFTRAHGRKRKLAIAIECNLFCGRRIHSVSKDADHGQCQASSRPSKSKLNQKVKTDPGLKYKQKKTFI